MRRWFFAFLLFVVPFQIVWGAAAPYCAHDSTAVAKKHFGHHEHRHQADGQVASAEGDSADASGTYHADCESCHLGTSVTLPPHTLSIPAMALGAIQGCHPPCYTSHVPSGPERPDRAIIAAAARFGGGVVFGSHPA
ncbi:MAG: hypothetical protein ACRECD_03645 [Burkholderiaceae bacterium]